VECSLPDGSYRLGGVKGRRMEIRDGKAELSIPALTVVYAEL